MLLLILWGFVAFSQVNKENFHPVILTKDSTAYLCFDSANSMALATRIVELQEQKEINMVHIEKIKAHDGLINNEKEISFNLSGQIVNYKNIVVEKDKQIDLGEEEMNKMKKEIRRQKFQKYLLIGAVLVVSAVGIIY